jgi:hypothetical protein
MFLLVLASLLTLNFYAESLSDSDYVSKLTHLQKDLLTTGYNLTVPPSESIKGFMVIFLKHINNIDEKKQTMNSSSTIYMQWTDSRLTWTPSYYKDVKSMLIAGEHPLT